MKVLGIIILSFLGLGIVGIIMKMLLIQGANQVLFFGFGPLMLIFLIQFVLTFFKIKGSPLKAMSALMSIALHMGIVAVIFRYLYWPGWSMMVQASAFFFIPLSFFFFIFYPRYDFERYGRFIRRNILIPWTVIVFFGLIGVLLPGETFYHIFSSKRSTMLLRHD